MTIVEELTALAKEWRRAAEELREDGDLLRDAGMASGYDRAASAVELLVDRWRQAEGEVSR